ncbi:hypothetical protein [Thermoplasma volcanium GSS1]|uniref:Oxidoreductase molybdopterin-binding domain-containing protein n=1 Tax=Thermoplasma volcanium (strain ATCC 51530 / DSM 4299 / JCM 9571 / NBRC 15438 / GSS1) TaxID=273116 RepID=Q97C88_THEVO|nr:sulfite oxidase-like oxidoreductase [Thermoplasma volcanium]BAB59357.1 hypothetical protein [Thermoplasma volcanium GSS1]
MDRISVKNPGQRYIKNFIIYDALGEPDIDIRKWKLCVNGLVDKVKCYSFSDLQSMRQLEYISDFNCVTRWSIKDIVWKGPSLKEIIENSGPKREARWVMFWSADGYSTPVPIEYAMDEKAIIAISMNGAPLKKENGYPARPFLPQLYGWKSAKWITEIELIPEYKDGYWEAYGYAEVGRIEEEERFKGDEWKRIRRNSKMA